MSEIKVVWMDDTVKTYTEVEAAATNQAGELEISYNERIDRSRQGTGRSPVDHKHRVIRLPISNIRWWGTPGKEVAW